MSTTFKKYLESKGQSNSGIEGHYRHLSYFLNWCEDENIESEEATYSEIIGYIKHLQKRKTRGEAARTIKQRTVQVYINSLKHYFTWLIKREVREDSPTRNLDIKGIKRQYLYDIFKKQELESLYEAFEVPNENDPNKNKNWFKTSVLASKRNKVILGLMIWQGLGTMELGKLNVKDLKLREGKIYVPGSRRSNERELKLEAHQVLDLMEYTLQIREGILKLNNKESEKLFVSAGESDRFSNIMQKLMQKLNKQNSRITSTNQIRASVITHWLKNLNLREVQYMAGHRYVSSTESYLINDLDDLQEDISKFHPIG